MEDLFLVKKIPVLVELVKKKGLGLYQQILGVWYLKNYLVDFILFTIAISTQNHNFSDSVQM